MGVGDKSSDVVRYRGVVGWKEQFHGKSILIKGVMHIANFIDEVEQSLAMFIIFERSLLVSVK